MCNPHARPARERARVAREDPTGNPTHPSPTGDRLRHADPGPRVVALGKERRERVLLHEGLCAVGPGESGDESLG